MLCVTMRKHTSATSTDYANRVTIIEAARLLGVSDDTIRRRIKAGALPALIIAGKFRIDPADLDAMVRAEQAA